MLKRSSKHKGTKDPQRTQISIHFKLYELRRGVLLSFSELVCNDDLQYIVARFHFCAKHERADDICRLWFCIFGLYDLRLALKDDFPVSEKSDLPCEIAALSRARFCIERGEAIIQHTAA